MTSPNWDRFRGVVAVVSAMMVFSLGMRSATADDPGTQDRPQPATEADKPSTGDRPAPTETPAVPQLQIQDEGPSTGASVSARRTRMAPVDDTEQPPFWKNWIFWTITGVLVAGAIGMVVYTASGTSSSLAPCPPDVVVSLGCFGTGR